MAEELITKKITEVQNFTNGDLGTIIQVQGDEIGQTNVSTLKQDITNSVVSELMQAGGVSLNLVNMKGTVPTYADLPTVDVEVNDAYQVLSDGLVYVWLGDAWSDGFNVQTEPTGIVEEGNTQAVSGGEVYESTVNALDLSDEFIVKYFQPADRSGITQDALLNNTAYYYAGENHHGAKKIYVKSIGSTTVNFAVIVDNGAVGVIVQVSAVKNVVAGVNEFNVSDLGFSEENLSLERFFIGVSPVTNGFLPFQNGSTPELKLLVKTTNAIQTTNRKAGIWVEIERKPFLTVDYPKTKELLENTVNKINENTEKEIPYSKNGLTLGSNGSVGFVYGDADTFYSINKDLKSIGIASLANGFANIYFVNINGSDVNILHSTQVACEIGNNTFTKEQLSAPSPVNDKPIYVLAGNETTQTPNIIRGGTGNPTTRPQYTLRTLNNELTTTNNATRFSHWLTVLEPDNLLVSSVEKLENIVYNLPSNESGIYDYTDNYPILPCDIFVDEANPTPLYKNSMFQKYVGQNLPSVNIISDNKAFSIQDPSYINHTELGDLARILIDKHTEPNTIIYKDLNVYKFNSAGKSGSISIMSLGDSLTEGGAGFNSSPIFLLTQQLQTLGITVNGVGTIQRTNSGITQRYEGRGGWRYRTFVGLEPKFSGLNVVIPSPTKNVWIEGTDGNINTIKANNVFLYEATAQDLIDYPQWCFHFVSGATTNNVRYSENPNLGTYHIFSPARYFSERGISFPNVITIALGTNEWYLGGFSGWDLPLITSCADWMIQRFLDAIPTTTALVVIPCNNMPLTRENEWQDKASFLTSSVLKIIEEKKLTNSNLYSLSIYAHGSRQLAYNKELSNTYLSTNNSTKVGIIDADVHILNTDDEGRSDYMNALKTAVLNFV